MGSVPSLRTMPGKAFSSIDECFSIEKLNSAGLFPTVKEEESNYWCYIQVSVRY